MATIAFDTLKRARKLEVAGFPQAQAADTAAALAESLGEVRDLATRADRAELRAGLKHDIAGLGAELASGLWKQHAQLAGRRAEFRDALNSHLCWIIGTIVAVGALAVAAVKLLP